MQTIRFKREHHLAQQPDYATPGSAAVDLVSVESGTVPAHGSRAFSTGLAVEVPEGHVLLIFSRSGHGFKNGIRLSNSVGVIDSDYRGVVGVSLANDRSVGFDIKAGDRIAQAILVPIPVVYFEEVAELSSTERGAAGYGSTGR